VNGPHQEEHSDSTAYIEKKMRRMMRQHHLPAMAVSIVEDEEILFQDARGFIDLENNIPATTNSVFKLYSVAKAFTAIEIFREVEEGFIDLDVPISEYLPEFSIQSRFPEHGPVTVKSILAHRSGLPRNGCISCPPDENDSYTLDKFERSTAECYMAFPVGFRYHYSNLGYNLLGRIVEQNRDMGFARYMNTHLLHDLGMESSTFQSVDISDKRTLALGYEYYKRKQYPMSQPDINNVPSGNLYSTIGDLSSFLKALLNIEVFHQENTLQQMSCDHFSTKEDPETMGLGWRTMKIAGDELMLWHDGGPDEGVGALVAFVPNQKIGIALVANSTSFSSDKSVPFVLDILNRLLEEKLNHIAVQAEIPQRKSPPAHVLKEYEGLYVAWGMPMAVEARKSKLKGKIGGMKLDLIPISAYEFRVSHWMDKIGLTKIFKPPVPFDKLRVSFPDSDSTGPESLIINLNHISYEICPRYPELTSLNVAWDHFLGNYQLAGRLPGNRAGELQADKYSIYLEDDVLKLSGVFGPILPLDDHYVKIMSGPFAGETMEYLPESGQIVHQNIVFLPIP
jgi:CubicO group peptidase (beta-lactamase class C family)